MVASDHAIVRDCTYAPTKRSLLELTTQDATLAQNKLLSRQIEALTETLSKLPQQLQAVGGCHTCGGIREPGQCTIQEDPSREVNYMGIPNRHGFQGYNQGGATGFNHGPPGVQPSTDMGGVSPLRSEISLKSELRMRPYCISSK
ncbi:hypothetical protein HKD37_18G049978 [Glycine soja]